MSDALLLLALIIAVALCGAPRSTNSYRRRRVSAARRRQRRYHATRLLKPRWRR